MTAIKAFVWMLVAFMISIQTTPDGEQLMFHYHGLLWTASFCAIMSAIYIGLTFHHWLVCEDWN